MCSAMLRVARPLWTPSSFQPVQPVRGRPARGRSPPRGVRRQRGSRLRPQTRMMPPRPGASASKWSRGRGKPEAPRTVKARKLPSSRAQRGSPGSPQSSEARCGPGTRSPRATHRRCRQPCCPRASCRPWCAASAHPAPFATRPQSWASCARACLEPSALHLACPARGSGSRAPGRSTRGTENRCPGLKPAPLLCPPCRPRLSISPLPLLPLLSLLSPPGLVLLQSHLPQGTGATTLSPDLERRQLKF